MSIPVKNLYIFSTFSSIKKKKKIPLNGSEERNDFTDKPEIKRSCKTGMERWCFPCKYL